MDITAEIRRSLANDWLPTIYAERVRKQRTRLFAFGIPSRENLAEIQYTLLGIELKVGKKRIACPDLATARYLRTFARIGCAEVAIPYDITRISSLADDLETSWQKMLLLVEGLTEDKPKLERSRARSSAIRRVREELSIIGGGAAMPAFDRQTRQRDR